MMTFLLSALAFVVLLTVLVLIHEWGHFAAARAAGVEVEEFGFGLPPRASVLFERGGTRFTLNWIPFGGFVRLKGENALKESERRAPGSFGAASIGARIIILVAGVCMNLLLAFLILMYGFSAGQWIPTFSTIDDIRTAEEAGIVHVDTYTVFIDHVISGGGAAQVGVPEQSILHSIDGVEVTDSNQVVSFQEGKNRVEYVVFTGEDFSVEEVFTVPLNDDGLAGVSIQPFARGLTSPVHSPAIGALLAFREVRVMTVQTVLGIGHLFGSLARRGQVPEGVTGLVGIAQLTHDSVQEGLATYLRLVALLSLSLAVLNILPFPALDGGRLIFVLAEFVSRRPVNRRFELAVNGFGFAFLLLLILVITFYDIIRLF